MVTTSCSETWTGETETWTGREKETSIGRETETQRGCDVTETWTGTPRGRESAEGCGRETRRGRREISRGFKTELGSTPPRRPLLLIITTTTPSDLVHVDRHQPYCPCPERRTPLRPPPPNPKDLTNRKPLQCGGHIEDDAFLRVICVLVPF